MKKCYNKEERNIKDTVLITFTDGRKEELHLPAYGEVRLTIKNGKVVKSDCNESKQYYK